MKKIILVFFGVLVFSCIKKSETTFVIQPERVLLVITENTTENQLKDIALKLKTEKNILFDFSKTDFYENGKINELNFEVDCNDGYKGSAKSSGMILKRKNSGFLRDYRPKSKKPFVIGAM